MDNNCTVLWRDIPAKILTENFKDEHIIKNRLFQGVPTIVKTKNGRLYDTWVSGGTGEPQQGNYGIIAKSDDDCKTWIDPCFIIEHANDKDVRIGYMLLWIDPIDRMWIIWNQTNTTDYWTEDMSVYAVIVDNPDDDLDKMVFSKPKRLFNGIVDNKPTVLSNGEWMFLSEDTVNKSKCYVYTTTDCGKSFNLKSTLISSAKDKWFFEPFVIELGKNHLWLLSRIEVGNEGGIEQAFSYDNGKTWSEFEKDLPSPLHGPGARFCLKRLKSGNILFINHDIKIILEPGASNRHARTKITAFLSVDNGKSWKYNFLIDGREDISYPDAEEDNEGNLYVTYDRGRAREKEILIVKFTEYDIIHNKTENIKRFIVSKV